METFLVILLVAATATFSYAKGLKTGRTQGYELALVNTVLYQQLEDAHEQALENVDQDEMSEEEYHAAIMEETNRILKQKFSNTAKYQDE